MYPLNININLSAITQENLKVNKGTLMSKGLQAVNIISLYLCLFTCSKVFALADLGNIEANNSSQVHSSFIQESLSSAQEDSCSANTNTLPSSHTPSTKAEIAQEQDSLAKDPLTKTEILNLIKEAEIKYHIPRDLLKSIARIESGHNQYYLNVSGKTFKTKSAISALSIINQEIAKGNNNIDIGVMQLNLRWHGSKFKDLKEMLDPIANIEYSAKHLSSLKNEYGNWHKAVRIYHSSNPEYYTKYSRKVLLSWLQEK